MRRRARVAEEQHYCRPIRHYARAEQQRARGRAAHFFFTIFQAAPQHHFRVVSSAHRWRVGCLVPWWAACSAWAALRRRAVPTLCARLDGGRHRRGAAADFLLFDSSRRVLHDSTRFVMPEDASKIVRVIKSMLENAARYAVNPVLWRSATRSDTRQSSLQPLHVCSELGGP